MGQDDVAASRIWAEFRFSVVGKLLSSPPSKGDLKNELFILSELKWKHPMSGDLIQFSFSSIERWYYKLLNEKNGSLDSLRSKARSDRGISRAINEGIRQELIRQYNNHRTWSYQLHFDNLVAILKARPEIGQLPSYTSIKRFFHSEGLIKRKRMRNSNRPGFKSAEKIKDRLEIRSFENAFVNGLWHLDFHHCSRTVLTRPGEWKVPIALAILDDHSRLICHMQWYLSESTEDLVHGFIQAIQKRSIPRSLLTDNGSAMLSTEFKNGLSTLGILHETTMIYSPYQNGKQENFWGQVEGRLIAMLESKNDLGLKELNDITLMWVEVEYNKKIHSEIETTPLSRFLNDKDVGRKGPNIEDLKMAFRREEFRTQRRSDGTILIEGIRFEVPSHYRHMAKIRVQYAKWDLCSVHLVDINTGKSICPLYPIDKNKNADGHRRAIQVEDNVISDDGEMAPLLKHIMEEYAKTGLPPAYTPKEEYANE
jgi:putative transposase